MRGQCLSISIYEAAQFVGNVRQRNVWPNKSDCHARVSSVAFLALVLRMAAIPFLISPLPFATSPRTLTKSAFSVYIWVAASASWLLKPSVISEITLLIADSS